MRLFTGLTLCVLVTVFTTVTAEARPGYLGPYRRCGYTYAEAMSKCRSAFVVGYQGSGPIVIEKFGKDNWLDASSVLGVRKVILPTDWNWLYYKLKNL